LYTNDSGSSYQYEQKIEEKTESKVKIKVVGSTTKDKRAKN
jgi:uncharacterized protein involved in tolerance to divalent cations